MNGPKHIWIVGGEARCRNTLAQAVESGGEFRVMDALDAMVRMQAFPQRLDAIIVQPAPADGDGIDLCSRLRLRGLRAPIIVLSEVAAEQDVIGALEAGANDYVVKPFRLAELKARLRAQIREYETSDDAVRALGPYQFCPSARYLHEPTENRLIRLTHKEVAILKCLYRATGRPVSRQTLLLDVWGYSLTVRSHTVETHIYRLRRKIEPDPAHPSVIVSDDHAGYRLGQEGDADISSLLVPLRPAPAAGG